MRRWQLLRDRTKPKKWEHWIYTLKEHRKTIKLCVRRNRSWPSLRPTRSSCERKGKQTFQNQNGDMNTRHAKLVMLHAADDSFGCESNAAHMNSHKEVRKPKEITKRMTPGHHADKARNVSDATIGLFIGSKDLGENCFRIKKLPKYSSIRKA